MQAEHDADVMLIEWMRERDVELSLMQTLEGLPPHERAIHTRKIDQEQLEFKLGRTRDIEKRDDFAEQQTASLAVIMASEKAAAQKEADEDRIRREMKVAVVAQSKKLARQRSQTMLNATAPTFVPIDATQRSQTAKPANATAVTLLVKSSMIPLPSQEDIQQYYSQDEAKKLAEKSPVGYFYRSPSISPELPTPSSSITTPKLTPAPSPPTRSPSPKCMPAPVYFSTPIPRDTNVTAPPQKRSIPPEHVPIPPAPLPWRKKVTAPPQKRTYSLARVMPSMRRGYYLDQHELIDWVDAKAKPSARDVADRVDALAKAHEVEMFEEGLGTLDVLMAIKRGERPPWG